MERAPVSQRVTKGMAPLLRASRAAFLIDGEAYFRALAHALRRARRAIYIAGWDIDARTRVPDPSRRGKLIPLTAFLDRLARRRGRLHIYLLGWDFAPLFAFERQPFPALHLGFRTHDRVHFVADGFHPTGAAHHQKIVVVDDRVAFSGGFDLAIRRWDTCEHRPLDRRRVDPNGEPYPAFHDAQIAVGGEAARALGDVFRERWRRATGIELGRVEAPGDPWPSSLAADAIDVPVSIARTRPATDDAGPLAEVRDAYVRAILAARRWIYIENQYISCEEIASLLAKRLDEPGGPEVVIVGPRTCSGWLEERTMGVLRGQFVAKLRAARFSRERLRVVYPEVGGSPVFVHAKVLVVDDTIANVGSANLSRRSMALDTECDVWLKAVPGSEHASAVASLRNRLLAEHLGATEAAIERELAAASSIVRLVDELGTPGRRLGPIEDPVVSDDEIAWVSSVADPEQPLEAKRLVRVFGRYVRRSERAGRFALGVLAAAMMVGLVIVAAWIAR